jgi:Uma2 family endonuclease
LPDEYHDVVPELVFEILSPSDRWSDVLQKVAEYLQAGVVLVCVVDPRHRKVHVYRAEAETVTLSGDQNLLLPEVFGDFAISLPELFR